VFAGAVTPMKACDTKLATPASCIVGMLGRHRHALAARDRQRAHLAGLDLRPGRKGEAEER
jgi:hypothetical protein